MIPHVTLVGYRACGKSTIGRLAAIRLGWPFVDADEAVEHQLGTSIAHFFATRGENAFRDQEAATIAQLLAKPTSLVLATGGGAVIRPETRERLRQHGGLVVWLRASPALVQERLRRHLGGRPSLTGASPADEAPRIMAEREPWYREVATLIIDADGGPVDQLADEVADAVRKYAQAKIPSVHTGATGDDGGTR